jgi:hypothetical protein
MLIAIAGFVASAATGFVVQEFLRRRRDLLFREDEEASARGEAVPERRRRKRAARLARESRESAPERPQSV